LFFGAHFWLKFSTRRRVERPGSGRWCFGMSGLGVGEGL
jgi:hypothetical protein